MTMNPDMLPHVVQMHPFQRRLTDKLLIIINHACKVGELEIAQNVLLILDELLERPDIHLKDRRKLSESMVMAHERLWFLRHFKD